MVQILLLLSLASVYSLEGHPTCKTGTVSVQGHRPQITDLSTAGQASLVSIFAAYLTTPNHIGPVFNLRRGNDSASLNFYTNLFGELGSSDGAAGTSFSDWVGSSSAHVIIWYDQSNQRNNAMQFEPSLQPIIRLEPSGGVVDFIGNSHLLFHVPLTTSREGDAFSYVVKHGKLSSQSAGIFYFLKQEAKEDSHEVVGLDIDRERGSYRDITSQFHFGPCENDSIVSATHEHKMKDPKTFINNREVEGFANYYPELTDDGIDFSEFGRSAVSYLGKSPLAFLNGELFSLVLSDMALSEEDRSILEGCALCPANTFQQFGDDTACIPCPAGMVPYILLSLSYFPTHFHDIVRNTFIAWGHILPTEMDVNRWIFY